MSAANIKQDEIQVLVDVEADLVAMESVIRRQHPQFEHPTLAKVRDLLKRIEQKGDQS